MATLDLTQDILAGNRRKSITEDAYNKSLARTFSSMFEKRTDYQSVKFDPAVHLKFYAKGAAEQDKFHNTKKISMEELGLTHELQISPIGVSDPFPLFTDEAVDIMRMEVLSRENFLENARVSHSSTSGLDCVVRGYVTGKDKVLAPFTHAAWTHPKTMELVSKMAGADLEIVMDYEIAHVNIGITEEEDASRQRLNAEAEMAKRKRSFSGEDSGDDIPAIVGWHKDSYPFVCVLMLSDTTNMVGGETYLRMGNSKLACVSGPEKGNAAVLQGRLINHLAPKPLGATERITMVTSYRAKDLTLHDGSVLSTVKPEINYGSRYDEFYRQWVKYRAGVIKGRLDKLTASLMEKDTFDKAATTEALVDLEVYLKNTYKEMEVTEDEWAQVAKKG